MRRSVLSLLFCFLFSVACNPPSKCPQTDDLSLGWMLESMSPKNKISLDAECPQTINVSLSAEPAVYATLISQVTVGKQISIVGTFTSLCDPDDGKEVLGILENGEKVASQESKLLTKKVRVDYTAMSKEVTYLVGVQSRRFCELSLQLVVTQ